MTSNDIYNVCYFLSEIENNRTVPINEMLDVHKVHCNNKYWNLTKSGLKKSNTFNDYQTFMKNYMNNMSQQNLTEVEHYGRHSFP